MCIFYIGFWIAIDLRVDQITSIMCAMLEIRFELTILYVLLSNIIKLIYGLMTLVLAISVPVTSDGSFHARLWIRCFDSFTCSFEDASYVSDRYCFSTFNLLFPKMYTSIWWEDDFCTSGFSFSFPARMRRVFALIIRTVKLEHWHIVCKIGWTHFHFVWAVEDVNWELLY